MARPGVSTLLAASMLTTLAVASTPGWTPTRSDTIPHVVRDASADSPAGLERWEFTLQGRIPPSPGHGHSNGEAFSRQKLPVPIVGLRWDHSLAEPWLVRTAVSGGALPRVDSLRREGGTVYLRQSHADGDAGLVYGWSRRIELEVGYHFTYFFQHEKSREDDNFFELIDNGARARLNVRF